MNQKVTQQFRDKPPQTHHWQETNNQTLLILTFSGGGTRAAAFSYGVLKGLQNSRIIKKGGPVPLLSEVDLISSVS
ncbi:MAG: patatin, partial [Gammaproteobacteria bacterium]